MAFDLHHDPIARPGARAWMLVLHGLLGRGQNWRSFARRLSQARPEWGCVLVDLREHGRSLGAPPPHTVAAAAGDLVQLTGRLTAEGRVVRAVAGHSFGGKVALCYRGQAGRALASTWIFDASPGARPRAMEEAEPGTVPWVLAELESLPREFEDREAFVRALVGRGFAEGVARWLAMNLETGGPGGGAVLRLDLASLRALLVDHYAEDLWPALEDEASPGEVHMVVAGRSPALDAAERDRLARLARERPAIHLHELPEAGHWVNVDALDELVALVAAGLPDPGHAG